MTKRIALNVLVILMAASNVFVIVQLVQIERQQKAMVEAMTGAAAQLKKLNDIAEHYERTAGNP